MEFSANIANLGKYNAGVLAAAWLSFPTTTEQVQSVLREIGVDGLRYEETIILEYSTGVKGLAGRLGEYVPIDELNYLARKFYYAEMLLGSMSGKWVVMKVEPKRKPRPGRNKRPSKPPGR